MSASPAFFLLIRASHVLLAALWVGATAFAAFFLFPALADVGPAAGPVMGALVRRRVPVFMASVGGTTVLTGIYLYYRFTSGFDPNVSRTPAAMVFGTGGILGLIALIVGGAVVSKNAKKMGELGARLASAAPEERAALAAQVAVHRNRATTGSRIVIVLQLISIVLMAIGHYV